jgi:hypothetical protein
MNRHLFLLVMAALGLTGCGLAVPDIKEAWDIDKPADVAPKTPVAISGTTQIEWEIKKRIYCDLKKAVKEADKIPLLSGPSPGKLKLTRPYLIPDNWGAQVSISLQVDESLALNPGVTFNDVMHNAILAFGPGNSVTAPQSFSLGLGATLSSTATRSDKYDPYYSIAFLRENDPNSVCLPGKDPLMDKGWTAASSSPFILESDLGITDWLVGAMMIDNALPSQGAPPQPLPGGGGGGGGSSGKGGSGGASGQDTVTLEIKFIIVSSGNVTPTWKLVRVSANTSASPLFSTGRTRTHDLIITVGPPGPVATSTHLASQIGNAVSNSNRAETTQ